MQRPMFLVQLFASVCLLAVLVECGPLDFLVQDILDRQDEGTEQHYDQRQRGEENYRVRVNGVVVKVPAPGMSSVGLSLLEGIGSGLLASANEEEEEDDDKNQTSWNSSPYEFELTGATKPEEKPDAQSVKTIVVEADEPVSHIVEDLVEDKGEGSIKIMELQPESEILEKRSKFRPKKTPFGLGSLMSLLRKQYD